jgi:hypothetical protein
MVKNITLSADESEIKQARKKAQENNTSLNSLFREWLSKYNNREDLVESYDRIMDSLQSVQPGDKFTREEMNER